MTKILLLLFLFSGPVMAETYKATHGPTVQRLSDGAFIPNEPLNKDWQAYQVWVASGNITQPADPLPTPAEILAELRLAAIAQLNTDVSGNAKVIRSVLLTILDEINVLRTRDRDRSVDVAAATSLADLKTRWAARASLADRTPAQGKTAVQSKIEDGTAD